MLKRSKQMLRTQNTFDVGLTHTENVFKTSVYLQRTIPQLQLPPFIQRKKIVRSLQHEKIAVVTKAHTNKK